MCIFIFKKVLSLYWINTAFKSATEKKKRRPSFLRM